MEVVRIGSYPMAGLFYSILYMGCCCINDFVKENDYIYSEQYDFSETLKDKKNN